MFRAFWIQELPRKDYEPVIIFVFVLLIKLLPRGMAQGGSMVYGSFLRGVSDEILKEITSHWCSFNILSPFHTHSFPLSSDSR